MQQTVLAVDFESCDARGTWIAFAAAVFQYPGGQMIDSIVRAVRRPVESYDEPRRAFWFANHLEAHKWIERIAQPITRTHALEGELCEFVRRAHRNYPHLTVLSDNPAFDLRLLDNMLCDRGMPVCSARDNGAWTHPMCSFSFSVALQKWAVAHNWSEMQRHLLTKTRATQPLNTDPLHTPLRDVIAMVNRYFVTLDTLHW